jgi:HEAT repeat protein
MEKKAKSAVKEIGKFLFDNDYEVRSLAVYSIGKIGTKENSIILMVSRLLDDPEPTVRISAAKTLIELDQNVKKAYSILGKSSGFIDK